MPKSIVPALVLVAFVLEPLAAFADDASKAAVTAAFAKMAQAKSYRMTMHAGAGDMTQEYVAPDRRHMSGPSMEMISIADDTWMKVNGKWQHIPKTAAGSGAMSSGAMGRGPGGPVAKPPEADVKFVGNQDCQGQPARVYSFSMPASSGPPSQSKFWIGASGYPCRMEMGGTGSASSMEWSDWGAPLRIKPPM